jgi:hypothetical protein
MTRLAALCLLLVGCSEAPTDYLLHVDSRMSGDPLHSIKVRTWATADTAMTDVIESSCFCVSGGCRALPVTMALVPTSDLSRRYQVEVIGYTDEACTNQLVTQLAKLQFVPHTSLDGFMDLTDNCVNVTCPAGQTCSNGICVDPVDTVVVSKPDGGQVQVDMSQPGSTPLDFAGVDLSDFCGSTCFAAGTEISLAGGQRRAIERVAVGDVVGAVEEQIAWSPVEPRTAQVSATMRHVTSEVLVLTVEGRELVTTAEHPFAVIGRGFVPAGRLTVGDPLLRANGREALVQAIEHRTGAFEVFNLEVAGDHTYFVSDLELVVHNKAQMTPCL